MIDNEKLKKFNEINLKEDLKIAMNSLTYDYSIELGPQINDLYNFISEAIGYINEETPSQFVRNIEKSINILFDILKRIKRTQDSLGHDFERQKQSTIDSINNELNEIFSFQDQSKLLVTLNYLKNDFFTKNTKNITTNMFEDWASGKNEGLNKFIETIEQKAKESIKNAENIEKSTEIVEQVKTGEGFKEFDSSIDNLTKIYEKYKSFSLYTILGLSFILCLFILGIKLGCFVDYDKFYFIFNKSLFINYPYIIFQASFGILLFSLLSYLLKISVDEYKIYSNIIINLKNKGSIIKSYLLFLKYGDDKGYAETNKLIIEKTLENLYKNGNGTHFGKEEEINSKIIEKILDILPKLK